jgi:hypothetical protein
MPGSKDPEPRGGADRLDEDLHAATTTHAELPPEIARKDPRRCALANLVQRREDALFDGPAAHGADAAPVRPEEQAGPGDLRGRARGHDHGGQRSALALAQQIQQRFRHLPHDNLREALRARSPGLARGGVSGCFPGSGRAHARPMARAPILESRLAAAGFARILTLA